MTMDDLATAAVRGDVAAAVIWDPLLTRMGRLARSGCGEGRVFMRPMR
jgi:ABC-type taurine transport system substrate-binding protein